ncbi:alpha/beta hydrolase family protein [Fructobacillus evanidus]|uniref:Acetyl esterase/lipase (Aes) n=1 Tax=Fructobacillus evanidus TaxID=3064281 RepID=A0ABM9MTF8_9LACO|nr:Acetyl esterase/lipase (Aes) [Fructobacillus sp. LMG 32999]CAK1235191.1 Acetyl esterase/lipase (Aes) [Fructobacillus sp. LMG 32999]CAK1235226.1 Acetyl esterase/lipase (Aes) [Fructobacillus sp. LMG 32999]CAK1238846.1 Acetyl esterase/lipase (Aes) [Fructobacillus sp. LMG 32999]CAK1239296.1 Acetyl esterase/lipase (Aes) [Fructobacillus sp. LMG 32999]
MKKTFNYGTAEDQFAVLNLPDKEFEQKLPVVISIHGGFWKDKYDLSQFTPLDQQLVDAGVATWNIEYRRVGKSAGGYPETFLDVTDAINYLAKIAIDYPLDLDRVVVIGHSAGGQLALWAASRYQHTTDTLGEAIKIKFTGVVSMAGVTDLSAMWLDQQESNMADTVPDFIGGTPEEKPVRYRDASPINQLPLGVATVLIHGIADDRVPVELSQQYYKKAKALGDTVDLIELPNVGHFELIDSKNFAWQKVQQVVENLLAK